MSPAMAALASVGITQGMLIIAILALVAAGVIGLYWHFIVPGAIILLVGSLFINFDGTPTTTETAQKSADVKKEQVQSFDERKAFMEDCINVAMYSKEKCENLWYDRQEGEPVVEKSSYKVDKAPESHVQLLDVDNEEYKQRRQEALAKPGAVVIRETYH